MSLINRVNNPCALRNSRRVRTVTSVAGLLVLIFVVLRQADRGMVSIPIHDSAVLIAVLTGLGAMVLLAGLTLAVSSILRQRPVLAWRMSWRNFNYYWLLATAAALLVFTVLSHGEAGVFQVEPVQIVGTVLPLLLGMQAALLFSPEDEPALEIMLACPRGIVWVLVERLLVLTVAQGLVALAGMALSLWLAPGQEPGMMLARWIPQTVLLSGFGLFVTLRSRVAAFGLAMTAMLWFAAFVFAAVLLPGGLELFFPINYVQPFMWGISPFLQPADLGLDYYWLNRACVLVAGLALMFGALWTLRDEESVLLGSRGAKWRIQ